MLVYTNAFKEGPAYLAAIRPEIVSVIEQTKDRRAYVLTTEGRTIYTNESVLDFISALERAHATGRIAHTQAAKDLIELMEKEPHKADKDINDDMPKAAPPKGRPGVNR